jgi:hypothetical protein
MTTTLSFAARARFAVATLTLLAATAACGGGDSATGPTKSVQPGTFTATVSGALGASLTGPAAFGSGDGGSGLAMGTADGKRSIGFTRLVEGVPPTGTYTLGDDTESNTTKFIASYVVIDGGTGALFVSRDGSGTLKITASSSSHVAGTFTWTGYDSDQPDARTITVTGSFDAPVGTAATTVR